ncbi:MAG: FecR domain-containing protein [Polyangiales bacterium]
MSAADPLLALGRDVAASLTHGEPARLARQRARLLTTDLRARPPRLAAQFAVAAALVAALAGVTRLRGTTSPPARVSDPVLAPGAWFAAGADAIELPFGDDARVRVERGARVRLVTRSAQGAELAVERGVVEVRVRHRHDTRWTLRAGPWAVAVTGTAFRLGWSPTMERMELDMREGSVIVRGPGVPSRRVVGGERVLGDTRDGLRPAPVRGDTPVEVVAQAVRREEVLRASPDAPTTRPRRASRSARGVQAASVTPAPRPDEALAAAADRARYEGRVSDARTLLLELRARHPESDASRRAAYHLGVLALEGAARAAGGGALVRDRAPRVAAWSPSTRVPRATRAGPSRRGRRAGRAGRGRALPPRRPRWGVRALRAGRSRAMRGALALAVVIAARAASAEEVAVQLEADGDVALGAQIRLELQALGHPIAAPGAAPGSAPTIALRAEGTTTLVTVDVPARGRQEIRLTRDDAQRGTDALRVVETLRALLLAAAPAPPSVPAPAPAPAPPERPVTTAPPWTDALGVGLGAGVLLSPGGASPQPTLTLRLAWEGPLWLEILGRASLAEGRFEGDGALQTHFVVGGVGAPLSRGTVGALGVTLRGGVGWVQARGDLAQSGAVGVVEGAVTGRVRVWRRLAVTGSLAVGSALASVRVRSAGRELGEWGRPYLDATIGLSY